MDIIIEKVFDAPVSKVWRALTDSAEMKKWFFDIPGFKAEKGFQFQFTGGPDNGPQYLHLCEVTEVVPEQRLSFSWRYDGYAGISFVSFELKDQGTQTWLKLTHQGVGSFPADNPDFAIRNFEMGWDQIINTLLKNHLK